ncbi:MAG: hypothetical protein Q9227_007170 [Pyrenula ochraceoflavens]
MAIRFRIRPRSGSEGESLYRSSEDKDPTKISIVQVTEESVSTSERSPIPTALIEAQLQRPQISTENVISALPPAAVTLVSNPSLSPISPFATQTPVFSGWDQLSQSTSLTSLSYAALDLASLRESLWKRAYAALDDDRSKSSLLEAYEQILGEHTCGSTKQERRRRMEQLIQSKIDEAENDLCETSRRLYELVTSSIQIVSFFKEMIVSAAANEPHVALAWAGIALLLPLILDIEEQAEELASGFCEVTKLAAKYVLVEKYHLSSRHQRLPTLDEGLDELERAIVMLYTCILNYEVHLVVSLSRRRAGQASPGGANTDASAPLRDAIRQAEQDCEHYFSFLAQAELVNETQLQEAEIKRAYCKASTLDARLSSPLRRDLAPYNLSVSEKKCISLLGRCDYQQYKNINPVTTDATVKWVLDHDNFWRWRESRKRNMLQVIAAPGCGKSTMVRHLIDSGCLEGPNTAVLYFFFKDADIHKESSTAVTAMLHQIFQKEKRLVRHARPRFENNADFISSFPELWQTFREVVTDPEAPNFVCVFDALDESTEPSRCELVEKCLLLQEEDLGKRTCKILFTNRPTSDMDDVVTILSEDVPRIYLHEDDTTDAFEKGLNIFTESELDRINMAENSKHCIMSQLKGSNNRSFLWINLVLKHLEFQKPTTESQVEDIFNDLPLDLFALYEYLLNKIPEHSQVRVLKLLQIVLAAERPLHVDELNEALGVTNYSKTYSKLDVQPAGETYKRILQSCGFLLKISENKVFLLHQTAKELFLGIDEEQYDSSWQHIFSGTDIHATLADICMRYLLIDDFKEGLLSKLNENHSLANYFELDAMKRILKSISKPKHGGNFTFLTYALKYWTIHLEKTMSLTPRLAALAKLLCQRRISELAFSYAREDYAWFIEDSPPLLRAVALQLEGPAKKLMKLADVDGVINATDKRGFTALHCAAWSGSFNTACRLLKYGAKLSSKARGDITPLHCCVLSRDGLKDYLKELPDFPLTKASDEWYRGRLQVMGLLLRHGADVNAPLVDGRTPLTIASGLPNTIRSKAFREELPSKNGKTPVTTPRSSRDQPATLSNRDFISKLIEYHADVHTQVPSGKTALSRAVHLGHREVAAVLLEYGADPQGRSFKTDEWTLLHYVASQADEKMLELLLRQGSDVHVQDASGYTPLHLASSKSHAHIASLVNRQRSSEIELRAPNPDPAAYNDALQIHTNIINLLLDYSSDPNKPNKHGLTPLHLASRTAQPKLASALLNRGAKPNALTPDGKTPLYFASGHDSLDLVKLLLSNGADPNAATSAGETPLMRAASASKNPAILAALLDKGAEVRSADDEERTAFHHLVASWAEVDGPASTAEARRTINKNREDALEQLIGGSTGVDASERDGMRRSVLEIVRRGSERKSGIGLSAFVGGGMEVVKEMRRELDGVIGGVGRESQEAPGVPPRNPDRTG